MNKRKFGVFFSYTNTVLNAIVSLFLTSFILNRLGSIEFGIYQSIGAFANYLVLFQLGIGVIMTRNIAMCRGKNENLNVLSKHISTIWLIIISVIFYFNLRNIYDGVWTQIQIKNGLEMFKWFSVFLIVSFLNQTLDGIILGFENYSITKIFQIIRILIRTLTLLIVLNTDPKALYIVIIDTLLCIIFFILTYIYCKLKLNISFNFSNIDFKIFINILPFALALFLQTIVNQANYSVDKFIISLTLTPTDVTIYSISMYIFSTFSTLGILPVSIYMPKIVMEVSKGIKNNELINSLVTPSRLLTLIIGTILFGFIALGQRFILIMYGYSYLIVWEISLLVMIPMFISLSGAMILSVLDALGLRLIRSTILLLTTILNIVLTFYFIRIWGILGAAIATSICTFVGQVIIMNFYYFHFLKLDVFTLYKKIYKGLLISLTFSSLITYLTSIYIDFTFLNFSLLSIEYLTIVLFLLYKIGFNLEEKIIFKKIFSKILNTNLLFGGEK